jgi:hypothetical protein
VLSPPPLYEQQRQDVLTVQPQDLARFADQMRAFMAGSMGTDSRPGEPEKSTQSCSYVNGGSLLRMV